MLCAHWDVSFSYDSLFFQCLSNNKISLAGVESSGLADLCPNVVDLDLSGNLLESWEEVLPIISQLQSLKFVNLARNKIKNNKVIKHVKNCF